MQPAKQQSEPIQSTDLETQVKTLEDQLSETKNEYLYLYSDFENFKKRVIRERTELIRFGWEPLAQDFLLIIDNMERALAHMPPDTDKTLVDGLQMILNQFKAVLDKQGIRHIDALEKQFNPEFHEVIGHEPSEKTKGTILKEESRGYTLHGRLLRPARVIVSSGLKTEDHEIQKQEESYGKNNRH